TADSELVVEGPLVPLPLTIPLTAGWNYVGYPSPIARDAISVLQPLIDAGVLMKVIDENGSNITENAGSWVNQIGDFEGGEGYMVKVSADVDLTIDEAAPAPDGVQGDEVFRGQQGGPPSHFSLPWTGNPFFRMNLWIFGANGVALSAGDEIGIFDGDVCVGAGVLTGPLSVENYLMVISSMDDGGTNGFTPGGPISLRIWLAGEQREITGITPDYLILRDHSPTSPPVFEALE
ncbi:MAG: hypothetical protein GY859_06600, partial [Desulfobacterales bacterium]|nr:hypothetical protein [Desulfobacterales bacterium]